MKKIFSVAIFAILYFTSCIPSVYKPFSLNSTSFKGTYSTFLEKGETEMNSWYHYMTSERNDGNFCVRVFYPENKQITSLATYSTPKFDVKDGISIKWADDGDSIEIGNYSDNMKVGHWKFFDKNNGVSSEGLYLMDKKEGIWKFYYHNKIKSEINFVNGIKQGEFFEYDTIGNLKNKGNYQDNEVIYETNKPDIETDEEMPVLETCSQLATKEERYECTNTKLLNYMYTNIKYPLDALNYHVEGTTLIYFVIDSNGNILEYEIRNGLCPSIKEECIRLIKKMPKFIPGKIEGQPVNVHFALPLIFKINY